MNKVKPKTIMGQELNGQMLWDLIASYTEAINKGAVPNIQQAWSYVCGNENQKALEKVWSETEEEFKTRVSNEIPMFEAELLDLHQEVFREGLGHLKALLIGDDNEVYEAEFEK